MNTLQNEINLRNLPDILTHNDGNKVTKDTFAIRRDEIKEILSREEYGFAPDAPEKVTAEIINRDTNTFAGKAVTEKIEIGFETEIGEFKFPVVVFIPTKSIGRKPAMLLHINFRPDIPDKYMPVEEIIDNGFACAQVYYEDITTDNGDFTNGIAAHYPSCMGKDTSWGKIRMWAFALSRVMDAFMMRNDIDTNKVFVLGHSRLGKTALVAAAFDERFCGAASNDSGCSGAAITRDKTGERVADITRSFPYWFCPNYKKYVNNEYSMPFDQHFLTALIAPRLLCIASAWEDTWADPMREFMSAVITAQIYPVAEGKSEIGNIEAERYPVSGESYVFADGKVHYHLRPGTHFFSRTDWVEYMSFLYAKLYR